MKYKGLEIVQMISKGQIEDGTRFDFKNNNFNGEVEYYNGTLYWIRFDENWKETGKKNRYDALKVVSQCSIADYQLFTHRFTTLWLVASVYLRVARCSGLSEFGYKISIFPLE